MHHMFHGTTADNANAILLAGEFAIGTHFDHHMEGALKMGGDYIFEICLDEKPTEYWEWRCPEPLSTDCVRMLISTNPSVIWHNQDCEKKCTEGFISTIFDDGVVCCEECGGHGQEEYYPPLMRRRDIKKVTSCAKCGGYGACTTDGSDVCTHRIYPEETE